MWVRCIKCNNAEDFAKTRGAKLSDRRCTKCSGKLETLRLVAQYSESPNGFSMYENFRGHRYFWRYYNTYGNYEFDKERRVFIPIIIS